ncbi:ion transporter, partial [Candidatus Saccharibacteria bacterium]|nr:ion transporter [Candidatus Saccharibacteria bacterium]
KPIGDALWWCTVTWFTVGYGDLYPLTGYGRLFGMYVIISSHIFIVLLTANVVAKLSQYRAEAALEEERRMHKQEMKLLRARLTKTTQFQTIEHKKKRFQLPFLTEK